MEAIKRLTGWRAGPGPSQESLVASLNSKRVAVSRRVLEVVRKVDRKHFVQPETAPHLIYNDAPLPIGAGQTISAPHMHVIALELLHEWLKPGARALDVGSGSGYLTACFALLVRPGGWVLGIEKVPELALRSVSSIQQACPELAEDTTCWCIRNGNVLDDEVLSSGPFTAIHVGAAADEIHQQLVDALAPGGRMVIPVGPRWGKQVLMAVDKNAVGDLRYQELMNVGYVPLVRPAEMEDGYTGPS